jgi:glycosyltransferase involved in cell wall biosynthesis
MSYVPQYSILITTYECSGKGKEFLEENLSMIVNQSYPNIQVIISDHSKDDEIENFVNTFDKKNLELIYTRYTEHYGNPCHNWNNALQYASGDYLHYLAMDDRFYDIDVIEYIVNFMEHKKDISWVATAHQLDPANLIFIPKWDQRIFFGMNTISGPSAIIIRKTIKHITLDPEFLYFLDLDWYYRLFDVAGPPFIIKKICWVNRVSPYQLSHTVCTEELKNLEKIKLINKYQNFLPLTALKN